MFRLFAGLLVCATTAAPASTAPAAGMLRLQVPVVTQLAPARCGQAALEMVLRFYGGDAAAVTQAAAAYDPVLRGSLITDLAAAARRAGFDAAIVTQTADSLVSLLATGVPPIVLYQSGRAPLTLPHYGVVIGWDPARQEFTLLDGGARPHAIDRVRLEHRCRTAGSQALVVRRRGP